MQGVRREENAEKSSFRIDQGFNWNGKTTSKHSSNGKSWYFYTNDKSWVLKHVGQGLMLFNIQEEFWDATKWARLLVVVCVFWEFEKVFYKLWNWNKLIHVAKYIVSFGDQ